MSNHAKQIAILVASVAVAAVAFLLVPKPKPFYSVENNVTPVDGFPPNSFAEPKAPKAKRVVAIGCARVALAVLDRDVIAAVSIPSPAPDWAFKFHGVPAVHAEDGAGAVLALKPDLVALTVPENSSLSSALTAAGANVVELPAGDPDPAGEGFDKLSAAAGVPERGPVARLVMRRRQAFAARAAAGEHAPPRRTDP